MVLSGRRLHAAIFLLAGLLWALSLGACGHGASGGSDPYSRLLRAEALVDSFPDSARRILDSIPREGLKGMRVGALHTLVSKWADYKLYIDESDDSLLKITADYYRDCGDRRRLMRADFLLARCRLVKGDYPGSVEACVEAMDMATQLNDIYFLARTNENLADNLCRSYNFSEARRFYLEAAEYFAKTTKPDNVLYMKVDAGKCLYNSGKDEEALALYDSILSVTHPGDAQIRAYVYESMIRPNIRLGRVAQAREAADSMVFYVPYSSYRSKLIEAIIYLSDGDSVGAAHEIGRLREENPPGIDEMDFLYLDAWLYSLSNRESDLNFALHRLRKMEVDSLMKLCDGGSELNAIIREYERTKASRLRSSLERYRIWVPVGILFLLVVPFVMFFIERKRRGRVREYIREKEEAVSELMKELNLQQSLAAAREADEAMSQEIAAINSICHDYYEKRNASDKTRLSVLDDIERHLSQIAGPDNIARLENRLNREQNGIAEKIAQMLPDLKPRDKALLLLSMTHLSAKTICLICGLKDNAYYYNRKRQLKSKISDSGHPATAEVLEKLD